MIKPRKEQPEFELQKQVCSYLRLQYPNVFFLSDTVASVKLTMPQQVRNKSIQCSTFKCPDLIVLKPNSEFSGLFIELKAETPYKINGKLKSNEHLKGQSECLDSLGKLGYLADFAWSFEIAKGIIDDYLNIK